MNTTAIYANRLADKKKVEETCHIEEVGNSTAKFYTPGGTLFAEGYIRVVYGDHGPYVEFNKSHIKCKLVRKFNQPAPPDAYYEWLFPVGEIGVKVYDQRRDVKHLKNPPKGGVMGNRKEGYADYVVGMIYVSPYDLEVKAK